MNDYPYQDGTRQANPPSGPYGASDGPYSSPQQPFTGYPPQPDPGYAQPAYPAPGQPPYYQPAAAPGLYQPQPVGYVGVMPRPTQTNGPGIASLVLGIIGGIICWIPFVGLPLPIVGLVLATVGMKRIDGKGLAIAGLVLSIIALVVSACITVLTIIGAASSHSTY